MQESRFDAQCVAQTSTDPQSNYKLAKEHLIDPADIAASNVPRIQHRGMAPDAHTASLFPGAPLIDDHRNIDDHWNEHWNIDDYWNMVAAAYVEKFRQWRITLPPGVPETARNTIILVAIMLVAIMLVAGGDEAEPLRTVLH
jgi:6-phosphogluconolactonase/glucosamine-6-phosphate isomerase/deaminase